MCNQGTSWIYGHLSSMNLKQSNQRVVVAMSGGVDSSVAALLLAREGVEAVGVSMQVWDYRQNGGCSSRATCCSPDDFTDARLVAAKVGIPYYVFDFEKTFRQKVIDKFVDSYLNGITPNPCIECNSRVKFSELRDRARALGADAVATGHYARIVTKPRGDLCLLRGIDRDKDQSYFLYRLSPEELGETIFPVGHLKKDEVRQIAATAGLTTAQKAESQDICFVSGAAHEFVARIAPRKPSPGAIVDLDGGVVGQHDGVHRFTVGQRRGLGLGGSGEPLYVLDIDAETSKVVVGQRRDLERESFRLEECSWVSPALASRVAANQFPIVEQGIVQVRSRHAGTAAELTITAKSEATVRFLGPWSAVSPGQAAVFYAADDEEVLGGGTIVK